MAKQSTVDERLEIIDEELHNIHQTSATEQFMVFRNQLLLVYACATAAGWLQVCMYPVHTFLPVLN
jgi:7-cyano-7-deazaguanine synthase in queuosine biosynthesis